MSKPKIKVVVYLPRRLYKVLSDITPLFLDFEEKDPKRGAITRALEYILQFYMESGDYEQKIKNVERKALEFWDYLSEKDKELILEKIKNGKT